MNKIETTAPKRRLGQHKPTETCLGCDRADTFGIYLRPSLKEIQGEKIEYETEKFFCTACEAEWMSPTQADSGFKKAVTLFLTKRGALTGADCEHRRKNLGWKQQELATAAKVGIATIKRLESGVHILTEAHNDATERALGKGEHDRSLREAATVVWSSVPSRWSGFSFFNEPVAAHSLEDEMIDNQFYHGLVEEPEKQLLRAS